MTKFVYCQTQIEGGKFCKKQCDHCAAYYAPLEKEWARTHQYGRVTKKKLIVDVNAALKRIELDRWECIRIERSRFREDDYQGGAYFWKAIISDSKMERDDSEILSFCSFDELDRELNNGAKIIITWQRHNYSGGFPQMEIKTTA